MTNKIEITPIGNQKRTLSPIAEQALKEAEQRRQAPQLLRPLEIAGQSGPEPTRYGDWEKNGIASDF